MFYFFSLDCPNFWHIAWRCSPGNFSAVGSVEIACAFENWPKNRTKVS